MPVRPKVSNSRIRKLFSQPGEKVIPYITAGYPNKSETVNMVFAAEQAGADMVELGMPFSDPLADGPIIQSASQIAIKNGVTLSWILNQVRTIRESSEIPIALMGYINPLLKYGLEEFLSDSKQAGVDGFIVPDLPLDEADDYVSLCKTNGISSILFVAPNTPGNRIRYISELAGDLIYCVSILGITGTDLKNNQMLSGYLTRVKKNSTTPFIVGFGIKSRKDVIAINQIADGAVVGTELIRRVENSSNPVKAVQDYVRELKGGKNNQSG